MSDYTTWVIQKNFLQDTPQKNFKNILLKNGISVLEIDLKDINYSIEAKYSNLSYNANIIYGSIPFVKRLERISNWIAYGFGDYFNFSSFVLKNDKDRYLNNDYYLIPFGEILRDRNKILKNPRFVRPNNPYKSFTGQVISLENCDIEFNTLKRYSNVEEDTLCVISTVKNIDKEWRFVIGNDDIISYSEYFWKTKKRKSSPPPLCVIELVKSIIKNWKPDVLYTVDVCIEKDSDNPKIVEYNSFSSAGFYDCDLTKIALQASEIAYNDYKEKY